MLLTLGTYLRLRREAARMSIEDVAAKYATEPRWAEHVRAEQLRLIEAGIVSPTFVTIAVLGAIYPIDMQMLVALATRDPRRPVPPSCPSCACTVASPCIDQVKLETCARGPAGMCTCCRSEIETLIATVIA